MIAPKVGSTYDLHERTIGLLKSRLFILSPFIKIEALKKVLDGVGSKVKIFIVARWRLNDLVLGASDLEVYNYLKEKGIKFYINRDIHLKLILADDKKALVGSANITNSGLGYSAHPNVEAVVEIPFSKELEKDVLHVVDNSIPMTQDLFEEISTRVKELKKISHEFIAQQKAIDSVEGKIKFPKTEADKIFFDDFPQTGSPNDLLRSIREGILDKSYLHDLRLFGLEQRDAKNITKDDLFRSFASSKSFSWQEKNIPSNVLFGMYSKILHDELADDPKPYRKDIKKLVQNMFAWTNNLSNKYHLKNHPHTKTLIRTKIS